MDLSDKTIWRRRRVLLGEHVAFLGWFSGNYGHFVHDHLPIIAYLREYVMPPGTELILQHHPRDENTLMGGGGNPPTDRAPVPPRPARRSRLPFFSGAASRPGNRIPSVRPIVPAGLRAPLRPPARPSPLAFSGRSAATSTSPRRRRCRTHTVYISRIEVAKEAKPPLLRRSVGFDRTERNGNWMDIPELRLNCRKLSQERRARNPCSSSFIEDGAIRFFRYSQI